MSTINIELLREHICSQKCETILVEADEKEIENIFNMSDDEFLTHNSNTYYFEMNSDYYDSDSDSEYINDHTNICLDKQIKSIFKYVSNPHYKNGKCKQFGKNEQADIHMINYNIRNWTKSTNNILSPNEIVITDQFIVIIFKFPFKNDIKIKARSKQKSGFTRKEIINIIVKKYKEFYNIEKNSSHDQHYYFMSTCYKCNNKKLLRDDFLYKDNIRMKCSICNNTNKKDKIIRKLPCTHKYHKSCIDNYISTDNICPECPNYENLILCSTCKIPTKTKLISTIIPVIQQEKIKGLANSADVDGLYGIISYEFNELFIKSLSYDTKNKILYPEITI